MSQISVIHSDPTVFINYIEIINKSAVAKRKDYPRTTISLFESLTLFWHICIYDNIVVLFGWGKDFHHPFDMYHFFNIVAKNYHVSTQLVRMQNTTVLINNFFITSLYKTTTSGIRRFIKHQF